MEIKYLLVAFLSLPMIFAIHTVSAEEKKGYLILVDNDLLGIEGIEALSTYHSAEVIYKDLGSDPSFSDINRISPKKDIRYLYRILSCDG